MQYLLNPNSCICLGSLLIFINLIALTNGVPVYFQILIQSISCVHLGCIFSTPLKKNKQQQYEKITHEGQNIQKKDAILFPIIASAYLFGIHLIFKYLPTQIVNLIFKIHFSVIGIISCTILLSFIISLTNIQRKYLEPVVNFKMPLILFKIFDKKQFKPNKIQIILFILLLPITILYIFTNYWILNNFFAIILSIQAIKILNVNSYKIGFLLLWLLFFYDIFWVYGTDIMVQIAKKIQGPIKLQFPNPEGTVQKPYSMLGLGDIVLPGIFISNCLKFQVCTILNKKVKNIKSIKLNLYFFICLFYMLSILCTFIVMKIFNHAQPALLYIVPAITFSSLIFSKYYYNVQDLIKFEEQKKQEQKQLKKQ